MHSKKKESNLYKNRQIKIEENNALIQELAVIYGLKVLMVLVIFIVGKWIFKKALRYHRKVWDVYFNFTEAVKKAFDSNGISIPFPQQDIYMHQVESAVQA